MTDNANVVLKYQTDESSLRRAERSIGTVIDSLQDIRRETTSVNRTTQTTVRSLADVWQAYEKQVVSARKQTDALGNSIKRATGGKQSGGLTSDGGRVGSLLSATGGLFNDVGIGGQAFSTLGQAFDVGEYLNQTGSGLAAVAGAAIPTIAALGAIAIAQDNYNKTLEVAKTSLNQAITSVQAYYGAISTGTTDTINKQKAELQAQKDIVDAQNRDITLAYLKGLDSGDQFVVALGRVFNSFKDVEDQINTLNSESGKLSGQIDGLNRALTSSQVAANDAAEALKKQTNAQLAYINSAFEAETKVLQLQREVERSGNTQAVENRLKAIEEERTLVEGYLDKLKAIKNPTQEVNDQIGQFEKRLGDLNTEFLFILNFDWSKLINPFQKLASALSPLAKLADGIADRWQRAEDASKKYTEDIKKIEEDAGMRRADIEKKYADQLVDIAKEASEAAQDALRDLQEKRAELARDFVREEADAAQQSQLDQMDAQVEAQRDEAKALQNHYLNLRRIREDAADREYEMALNRDFAGLFFSRRDTNKQLNRANEDFSMERAERQAQLAQNVADIRQSYERERAQRYVQYQQDLVDAQAQYQRERNDAERQRQESLAKARETRNREMQELADNLRRQLDLRRQVWQEELRMITTIKQVATGATATIQNVVGTIAKSFASSIFGGIFRRADGGGVSPGSMYAVNDGFLGQRESFGGVPFPPGLGLFIPSRQGYVSAGNGGGGVQLNMPITVQAAQNPQMTANAVGQIVHQKIVEYFG